MNIRKLLPVLFAGLASAASAQDVGGSYTVLGTNLDGSGYSGTAEITWTSDVTCEIVWTTGATTSNGICMQDGNAFVAGYNLQDSVGLVIYTVGSDGTLAGKWTLDGMNGVGTEILTRM